VRGNPMEEMMKSMFGGAQKESKMNQGRIEEMD
jgi:hypothetical protein